MFKVINKALKEYIVEQKYNHPVKQYNVKQPHELLLVKSRAGQLLVVYKCTHVQKGYA